MTKGKWIAAEADRATACETAFQNGGPKVYAYKDWKQRPVHTTASQAILNNDVEEVIYARRKVLYKQDGVLRGRYEWLKWEAA